VGAAFCCLALQQLVFAESDDPNARILRLERLLKAAVHHQAGTRDDWSREVAAWSYGDLRVLRVDESVMAKLLRNPAGGIRPVATREIPAYTSWQVRRLRELAKEYAKLNERDALVVRGALLHGDVAMSNPATESPDAFGSEGIRIQAIDGEAIGLDASPIHWQMARLLFDAARPDGDEIARRWYIATAAWLQDREDHDTAHLRHAREMFPNDVVLQFLSGCQMETFAGPGVQSIAKTAVLPTGFHADIESESVSLREAETFLRRAVTLDPGMTEARIRLGHVLLARGRPQEAAEELRKVDAASVSAGLQYYHAMFLGHAEDALGRVEPARQAYSQASMLFPNAQSPYLALSALAARRGERATALKEMQRVFELSLTVDGDEDPWWSYHVAQAKNADALLEALFQSLGR
jgi:tetratricopeptide (TPR) repeat protein